MKGWGFFCLFFQGHKSVLSVCLKKKSLKLRKPHLGWWSNDQWEKLLVFKVVGLHPWQLWHQKTDAWAGRSTHTGGGLYHLTPQRLIITVWSSLWSKTECQKQTNYWVGHLIYIISLNPNHPARDVSMCILQQEMWSAYNLTKSNTAPMKQERNLNSIPELLLLVQKCAQVYI